MRQKKNPARLLYPGVKQMTNLVEYLEAYNKGSLTLEKLKECLPLMPNDNQIVEMLGFACMHYRVELFNKIIDWYQLESKEFSSKKTYLGNTVEQWINIQKSLNPNNTGLEESLKTMASYKPKSVRKYMS